MRDLTLSTAFCVCMTENTLLYESLTHTHPHTPIHDHVHTRTIAALLGISLFALLTVLTVADMAD